MINSTIPDRLVVGLASQVLAFVGYLRKTFSDLIEECILQNSEDCSQRTIIMEVLKLRYEVI